MDLDLCRDASAARRPELTLHGAWRMAARIHVTWRMSCMVANGENSGSMVRGAVGLEASGGCQGRGEEGGGAEEAAGGGAEAE